MQAGTLACKNFKALFCQLPKWHFQNPSQSPGSPVVLKPRIDEEEAVLGFENAIYQGKSE